MRASLALLLLLLVGPVLADDQDDIALSLPSSAPQVIENMSTWNLFVEGYLGHSEIRNTPLASVASPAQLFSVDLRGDTALTPGLRAILADRFDLDWQNGFAQRVEINTLKEAYLSWQLRDDMVVDLGRLNQYSGVGIGYNPTDFFRTGTLRSQVSADPGSIKKNRQGSVMLRAQKLWEGASLTALYSPELSDHADYSSFSTDLGATNFRDRVMLIFSKRISDDLNPQWLLYKQRDASLQFGMNLTKLVDNATVAYFEWSGGRSSSLLSQSLGQQGRVTFRNRVATGLTYTTSNKLSLTLEYAYNGAGLDKTDWGTLPQKSLAAYSSYRQFIQSAQEMPTRHEVLLYAAWQDVLFNHLDLTAMIRRNTDDFSRLVWGELRYRRTRDEIALQWQRNSGDLFTGYGALPLYNIWQVSYRHYF